MKRTLIPIVVLLLAACAGTEKEVAPNEPPKTEPQALATAPPPDPATQPTAATIVPEEIPAVREEGRSAASDAAASGPVPAGVIGGAVGGVIGEAPLVQRPPGTPVQAQKSVARYKLSRSAMDVRPPEYGGEFNTEEFGQFVENRFLDAATTPLSTFGVDVDRASYALVRRYLNSNALPPRDAVRIEELINYFHYDYPEPTGSEPFSVMTEMAACPWAPGHELLMIGLQGRRIAAEKLPPSNLVFLLDVSGSMSSPDKLPLLKSAFAMLVENLREDDHVAIVVYAGSSGLVLPPTSGADKGTILGALERLEAGGSTQGAAGIRLAYQVASENFDPRANNRVILATDGDFNVGVTSDGELEKLIEEKKQSGVFLSVLGFGRGNIKDSKMEILADKGNGNYAYIDSTMEAKKVLVTEMGGTLFTIAKDVKLQVEFNPAQVASYRLIGYENRALRAEDFNDDKKDAGEIGAGHSVTALYEIVPAGSGAKPAVDPLKYQTRTPTESHELATVKVRYKRPDGDVSRLSEYPVGHEGRAFRLASNDLQFAAAVAELGLLLRASEHRGSASYEHVIETATRASGRDRGGYRGEFVRLAERAARVAGSGEVAEIVR
jgi:Ca-activated chloride channel family protein